MKLDLNIDMDASLWPGITPFWERIGFLLKQAFAMTDVESGHKVLSEESRKETFGIIMNQYSSLISRICFAYARNREDLDDLRQDVFINIWKGLSTYRRDCTESTWIYRIALNTCISFVRKRSLRVKTISVDEMLADVQESEEDDSLRERMAELHKAISILSPIERAIITMRLDEHSYEKIAEVIGISRNNVAIRLHRIKSKLSKIETD